MRTLKISFSLFVLLSFFTKAQISIIPLVKHTPPTGTGGITLTVSGGTAPYTYTWNPGNIRTKDISNVSRATYTLNVRDNAATTATKIYNVGYKTYWTNTNGCIFRNDSLIRISPGAASGWNEAVSKNTLRNNVDGWSEIIVPNAGNYFMVGFLDDIDVNTGGYTDIDKGIYIASTVLYPINNGAVGTPTNVRAGDVVKFERSGSTFNIYLNGAKTYSTSLSNTINLKLKALVNAGTVANIGANFIDSVSYNFPGFVRDIATIKHIKPGLTNGVISVSPMYSSPHSYTWTPGSYTTYSINNLSAGTYTLLSKDPNANISSVKYNVGYKTYWTNFYGCLFRNDSLMRSSAPVSIGWNETVSKNTLRSGNDGWAEVIAPGAGHYYMLGFLDSASVVSGGVNDIDKGFYIQSTILYPVTGGSTGSAITLTQGDVIRIERSGSNFYLKRNGIAVYTSTISSTANLKLKTAISTASVANIGCNFTDTTNFSFPGFVRHIPVIKHTSAGSSNGSITLSTLFSSPHTYTWSPGGSTSSSISGLNFGTYTLQSSDPNSNSSKQIYNVGYKTKWTNMYGCMFRNDSILKTFTTPTGWNEAVSKNTLTSNTDGWVEFVAPSGNQYYMLGFLDSLSVHTGVYNDIDRGLYYQAGLIYPLTSGGNMASAIWTYPGDVIRIERNGSNFYIKRNGSAIYTNTISAGIPLKIKTLLTSGSIANVGASFADSTSTAFPNYVKVKPLIKHSSGVYINDGSLKATPKYTGPSFTYTWQPEGEITNTIYSKGLGTYALTVKDTNNNSSNYYYNVLYKSNFNTLIGCTFINDTLKASTPYSSSGWFTGVSKNILPANQDGEIKWQIQSTHADLVIGYAKTNALSTSTTGVITDIYSGLYYYNSNGQVWYYSGGATTNLGYAYPGDYLSVKRIGSKAYCYINGVQTATFNVTEYNVDWKLKVGVYGNTNAISDIGCSFPVTFPVLTDVEHASYENRGDGSAELYLSNSTRPAQAIWYDGQNTSSRKNLSPGSYTVAINDSTGNYRFGRVVNIGIKPYWVKRNNLIVTNDSIWPSNPDSAGLVVSENVIKASNKGWFETTIKQGNPNFVFGLLGINNSNVDTNYTIPVYPDSIMNHRMKYSYKLDHLAWRDSLTLVGTDSIINMGTNYDNLFLVKLINGKARLLFNGASYKSSAAFKFNVGDVLKVGRDASNNIYFARNDTTLYTRSSGSSSLYLYSTLAARSVVKPKKNGILTPIDVSPYLSCSNDNSLNWTVTRTYNEYGQVVEESKEYFDNFGREAQAQMKMFSNNNILAAETMYDSYGRTVGQTLPAPIYKNQFCYQPLFFANGANTHYGVNDFDKPIATNSTGEINNPANVNNNYMGNLGWYYSNNNGNEPLVAADNLPYARTVLSNDPLNRPEKSGGVGKNHKLGSRHEDNVIYINDPTANSKELINVFPYGTYELKDDFTVRDYPHPSYGYNPITPNLIDNVFKTIQINADGHDFISYKTSTGKLLATCMSGYDSDCPNAAGTIDNNITSTYSTVHLAKQYNTSLNIVLDAVHASYLSYIVPVIKLYTTKKTLVSGTDYLLSNGIAANGDGFINVSFNGAYANQDLFLEVSYQLTAGAPTPPSGMVVHEKHTQGYTQWTVYYYDVKGRLKATQSPNDVKCGSQPKNVYGVVSPASPSGFSCENTVPSSTIALRTLNPGTHDSVYQKVVIKPQPHLNLFSAIRSYTTSNAFRFSSDTAVAPFDSLWISPVSQPDSLVTHVVVTDTLHSLPTGTTSVIDTLPSFIYKRINIKGKYTYSVEYLNRSVVSYTNAPVYFDYDIIIDGEQSKIIDMIPGDGVSIYVDSAALHNADKIYLHTKDLTIKLQGFNDAPYSSFSPCNQDMYVGAQTSLLLTSINANISMPVSIVATPVNPAPQPVTFSKQFYYNEYDHLVGTWSKDENKTNYLYDLVEDKLMFSQNEKQRLQSGRFSYIKYDNLGRPVESGEHDQTITDPANSYTYFFQTYSDFKQNGVPSGVVSTAYQASINTPLTSTTRFTDKSFVAYDLADNSGNPLSGSGYGQKYTHGEVSKTWNDNSTTWYSYNELGRLLFTVQNINNLGVKTMEYDYDFRGKLKSTTYQRGQSDVLQHLYSYDADERLVNASYRRGTTSGSTTYPISANTYYTHGALKRTVLGRNIQGMDYVYTIGGLLKSINNPLVMGTGAYDPGFDGQGNSMPYDMFAMALEYYPGDYERQNSVMSANKNTSAYNDLNVSYTGLVHAQRWGHNLPGGVSPTPVIGGPLMYEYNYDELYRLTDAQFCNYSLNTSSNANFTAGDLSTTALGSYKLGNITYDRNGNIKTLKRYAELSSGQVLMDDLTYNYSSTFKNRLLSVSDANTNTYSLSNDINLPNQSNSNNYQTNAVGQLTVNIQDDQKYDYDYSGLTTSIKKQSNSNLIADFKYNDKNLRQYKTSYDASGNPLERTWYVYDAAGALIATYYENIAGGSSAKTLQDMVLYGNGRAGVLDIGSGKASFEINDQVGNVRMVLEDNGNYSPVLKQYTDYYPHGGVLPGRSYVSGTPYRFMYQGQEKDGESGLTNFELRQFDARIGRWLTTDPYGQHHSPYLAMSNNPINSIDPDGGFDLFGGFDPIKFSNVSVAPGTTFSQAQLDAAKALLYSPAPLEGALIKPSGDVLFGSTFMDKNTSSYATSRLFNGGVFAGTLFDFNINQAGRLGGSLLADGSYYSNGQMILDAIVSNAIHKAPSGGSLAVSNGVFGFIYHREYTIYKEEWATEIFVPHVSLNLFDNFGNSGSGQRPGWPNEGGKLVIRFKWDLLTRHNSKIKLRTVTHTFGDYVDKRVYSNDKTNLNLNNQTNPQGYVNILTVKEGEKIKFKIRQARGINGGVTQVVSGSFGTRLKVIVTDFLGIPTVIYGPAVINFNINGLNAQGQQNGANWFITKYPSHLDKFWNPFKHRKKVK